MGSICTRASPASTWTLGIAKTCRTLPENGATTCISIFMASSTANRSPAETIFPGFTTTETTTAGRRVHHTTVIAIDAVYDPVHFDQKTETLDHGDDIESLPHASERVLELTEAATLHVDACSVCLHSVVMGTKTIHFERVGLPPVSECYGLANFTPDLRSPAYRRSVKLGLFYR